MKKYQTWLLTLHWIEPSRLFDKLGIATGVALCSGVTHLMETSLQKVVARHKAGHPPVLVTWSSLLKNVVVSFFVFWYPFHTLQNVILCDKGVNETDFAEQKRYVHCVCVFTDLFLLLVFHNFTLACRLRVCSPLQRNCFIWFDEDWNSWSLKLLYSTHSVSAQVAVALTCHLALLNMLGDIERTLGRLG